MDFQVMIRYGLIGLFTAIVLAVLPIIYLANRKEKQKNKEKKETK